MNRKFLLVTAALTVGAGQVKAEPASEPSFAALPRTSSALPLAKRFAIPGLSMNAAFLQGELLALYTSWADLDVFDALDENLVRKEMRRSLSVWKNIKEVLQVRAMLGQKSRALSQDWKTLTALGISEDGANYETRLSAIADEIENVDLRLRQLIARTA